MIAIDIPMPIGCGECEIGKVIACDHAWEHKFLRPEDCPLKKVDVLLAESFYSNDDVKRFPDHDFTEHAKYLVRKKMYEALDSDGRICYDEAKTIDDYRGPIYKVKGRLFVVEM